MKCNAEVGIIVPKILNSVPVIIVPGMRLLNKEIFQIKLKWLQAFRGIGKVVLKIILYERQDKGEAKIKNQRFWHNRSFCEESCIRCYTNSQRWINVPITGHCKTQPTFVHKYDGLESNIYVLGSCEKIHRNILLKSGCTKERQQIFNLSRTFGWEAIL